LRGAQGPALRRDGPVAASQPCPHVKGSRRSIPRHAAGLFPFAGSRPARLRRGAIPIGGLRRFIPRHAAGLFRSSGSRVLPCRCRSSPNPSSALIRAICAICGPWPFPLFAFHSTFCTPHSALLKCRFVPLTTQKRDTYAPRETFHVRKCFCKNATYVKKHPSKPPKRGIKSDEIPVKTGPTGFKTSAKTPYPF